MRDIIKYSVIIVTGLFMVTACENAIPELNVVEVVAADYAFAVPDEIPSGWTTFLLNNEEAHEIHEISLAAIPEGKSYADYVNDFLTPWEIIWEQQQAGEVGMSAAEGFAAFMEIAPEWTAGVTYVTSRGLVSPGRSSSKILYLEPGTYAIDCWVKAPDGTIHLSLGMTRELIVTDEDSGESEPESDIEIMLLDTGIQVDRALTPGNHTVAVRIDEEMPYNNVHLIRMDEETDLAEVTNWLNWYQEGGLQAPVPADFMGGVHTYGNIPYGDTAYFTVENIVPGEYAWVVESDVEEEYWKTFMVE